MWSGRVSYFLVPSKFINQAGGFGRVTPYKEDIVKASSYRVALLIIAATFALLWFNLWQTRNQHGDKLEAWNIYRGSMPGWNVQIDETILGGQRSLQVTLKSTTDQTANGEITGHLYGTGVIEKIFRCGYPDATYGCNAVKIIGGGAERQWEPCPADATRAKPFTDDEVRYAMGAIFDAIQAFHNKAFLVSTLETWQKPHSL